MTDTKPNLLALADAREAQRKAHADKARKMFEDHPELFERAIIIDPEEGIGLFPEWMNELHVVGVLESAKFGLLLRGHMEGDGG